ncbi:hypothetical protein ANN_20770 [Periplaneta americana]|uniref:Uncharacterized protein n=1 Tax=Periplaneta americana TaxID=6978 RepID=A0ABQ8SE75_PERAM|nr:hypothetical protein ANN_20770 [Periplaneta americana]
MSPGSSTESYPAFAHIGLRENPGKNLNQRLMPAHDVKWVFVPLSDVEPSFLNFLRYGFLNHTPPFIGFRNDRNEIQIQTVEPVVPEPTISEVEIAKKKSEEIQVSSLCQMLVLRVSHWDPNGVLYIPRLILHLMYCGLRSVTSSYLCSTMPKCSNYTPGSSPLMHVIKVHLFIKVQVFDYSRICNRKTTSKTSHYTKVVDIRCPEKNQYFRVCAHLTIYEIAQAHLNAIDLARDRTRNLGHRRPALYQLGNQVDLRENSGKNLNQVTCPKQDFNLGPLVSRSDVLLLHSGGHAEKLSVISWSGFGNAPGLRVTAIDFVRDRAYLLVFRTEPIRELRFVIGTHCCEHVILVSVQSAASASATEIKDSRMQLRRATSAVHKRAAKCTQAYGDIF